MPPNAKGGKGYKKGKHGSGDADVKLLEWDEKDGQMLGRVLRALGNRRFRVYCNDNRERVCKLAGSMRKSEWVDEGHIVLLSIRGLTTSQKAPTTTDELGDILTVVDSRMYGKLKKQAGVNQLLFTQVEKEDLRDVQKRVEKGLVGPEDDDLFDRGGESEEEDEDEDEEDGEAEGEAEGVVKKTAEERKKEKELRREKKNKERDQVRNAKRDEKYGNDEIDIDAI